jgi:hypothetical protein
MLKNADLMNIVVILNLFYCSLLMLEHASGPIRTKIASMKLNTFLGLVFVVKRLLYLVHLNQTVSKLAFIAVSAVCAVRLEPILAHLSLILGLVALLCRRLVFSLALLFFGSLPPSPPVPVPLSALPHFIIFLCAAPFLYLVMSSSVASKLLALLSREHHLLKHLHLSACQTERVGVFLKWQLVGIVLLLLCLIIWEGAYV